MQSPLDVHLRTFLEKSASLCFMKDLDGRYFYVNAAFEAAFGLAREAILGRTDHEIFTQAQAEQFTANDRQALEAPEGIIVEEHAQHADGIHISAVAKFALRDELGATTGVGGIATDITARTAAEEVLRREREALAQQATEGSVALREREAEIQRSHDLLAAVCNGSTDAIFVKDQHGRYLMINENGAAMAGRSPADFVGRDDSEFFAPESARLLRDIDSEVMASGQARTWEEPLVLQGELRTFLTIKAPFRARNGDVVGLVGIARDITARKRAEEALAELNTTLERQVVERTQALNAAYVRLGALAREVQAVEEKERRRLSRELHDEVGQVLGVLRFDLHALAHGVGASAPAAIDAARDRLRSASGTIDGLFLSLRRVIAALRPAALDDFGLVVAMEALVDDVRKHSGIRFRFVHDGSYLQQAGPEVEGALYRMMQEALTNVVRHSGATSATVTFSRESGALVLVVQDDGQGIETPDRRDHEGFGLRGIRERAGLLGGAAEVESVVGQGTTVRVRVPVDGLPSLGRPS